MSRDFGNDRRFFHSFPRPKKDESEDATLERGLAILTCIKEVGLILAPEIVDWDLGTIGVPHENLSLLQRRACFTELSVDRLSDHSAAFGPIALSFDLADLRRVGAFPVIYVPQGEASSPMSQIGTFCARGAYHTRYVLNQLRQLQLYSDPAHVAAHYGMPVSTDYEVHLANTDKTGKVVAEYQVPASSVQAVLQYVGYNNIPFDHSAGVLGVFLNMFYPTDNLHSGDALGYYRQREWRLIAGGVDVNSRPIGRSLTDEEVCKLHEIDRSFWTRELVVDGAAHPRSALALVYEPVAGWDFFEVVKSIFVPQRVVERVRAIVGSGVEVVALG